MHGRHVASGILTGILTGALALTGMPDAVPATADVIVRGTDTASAAAAVVAHGGEVELELGIIDGVAAQVPVATLAALRADARTTAVTDDAPIGLSGRSGASTSNGRGPQRAVDLVGGGDMRRSGWDGSGVDIAIVDTGVEPNAALPADRVEHALDVSLGDDSGRRDGYGHGTVMATIMAGEGRGEQRGVAPGARIVDVKVADAHGMADVSQVLAGIDWVVTNRATDGRNIRVLSLSFGTDGTNPAATSPLAYAVEAAWRHGIVVVAAAGNHGDALGHLQMPAASPNVLAVGAMDPGSSPRATDDAVPVWSGHGDGVRDPDVLAPGRAVVTTIHDDATIVTEHPDAYRDRHLSGSGTSQATAFVAGVAAVLLDADPTLTPDQVKGLLRATADPVAGADPAAAGRGAIDLDELFPGRDRLVDVDATLAGTAPVEPVWSDGSGSLDGDRGSFVLEDAEGNLLTGDTTVVGEFDREAWLGSTWTGSTWTGSTWTGSTWTGSTWTGSTWTGSTWTGSTWTGSTWTGSTWTGSTWTGSTWTGSTWTGSTWTASTWTSAFWGE